MDTLGEARDRLRQDLLETPAECKSALAVRE
jgi:hypothetical protein